MLKLSGEECERRNTLIRSGKHRAGQLLKAHILLKSEASEAVEAWSARQVAGDLDTSGKTVAGSRQQLVDEGFEAVLTRKHSPNSACARIIIDGAPEAKRIALVCSERPTRRAQ